MLCVFPTTRELRACADVSTSANDYSIIWASLDRQAAAIARKLVPTQYHQRSSKAPWTLAPHSCAPGTDEKEALRKREQKERARLRTQVQEVTIGDVIELVAPQTLGGLMQQRCRLATRELRVAEGGPTVLQSVF